MFIGIKYIKYWHPSTPTRHFIKIIKEKAHSDTLGDGKIFVLDVIKTIRIRTGEEDEEAL